MHCEICGQRRENDPDGRFLFETALRTQKNRQFPEWIREKTPSLSRRLRGGERLKISPFCSGSVRQLSVFCSVSVRFVFAAS
jgi:hypothetical protein